MITSDSLTITYSKYRCPPVIVMGYLPTFGKKCQNIKGKITNIYPINHPNVGKYTIHGLLFLFAFSSTNFPIQISILWGGDFTASHADTGLRKHQFLAKLVCLPSWAMFMVSIDGVLLVAILLYAFNSQIPSPQVSIPMKSPKPYEMDPGYPKFIAAEWPKYAPISWSFFTVPIGP